MEYLTKVDAHVGYDWFRGRRRDGDTREESVRCPRDGAATVGGLGSGALAGPAARIASVTPQGGVIHIHESGNIFHNYIHKRKR